MGYSDQRLATSANNSATAAKPSPATRPATNHHRLGRVRCSNASILALNSFLRSSSATNGNCAALGASIVVCTGAIALSSSGSSISGNFVSLSRCRIAFCCMFSLRNCATYKSTFLSRSVKRLCPLVTVAPGDRKAPNSLHQLRTVFTVTLQVCAISFVRYTIGLCFHLRFAGFFVLCAFMIQPAPNGRKRLEFLRMRSSKGMIIL